MLSLLRQRSYALLWWSAFISGIGNFILVAALPYYVYSVSGSTLASGATFISETVPMVLFSSVGGIFADRWGRKRVIIASDWLRGLVLLPLLFVHSTSSLWIVYIVGFLGASVAHFVGPFGNAALPHIVAEQELPTANAAFSAGGFLAVLVGSSLGALLLQHVGLGGVVVADAATFAVSGILTSLIGAEFEGRGAGVSEAEGPSTRLGTVWNEWLLSIRFVLGQRWISAVFLVMMLVFLGNSMVAVCIAPFVRHVLHGSAQIYAWTLTAQGTGGVLASVFIGSVTVHIPPERMLAWSILSLGLLDTVIAVAQSIPVTLGSALIAGVAVLFGVAGMNTLVQAKVPDGLRGRVSGAFLTASALMSLLGSVIASVWADRIGIRLMLGIGGLVFVVAAVTAFVLLVPLMRRMKQREVSSEAGLAS
jgi:MFS family permease